MTTRDSDIFTPALTRILNSIEAKVDKLDAKFDVLDAQVDSYTRLMVSKEEFQSYQDLKRSQWKWAVTTIVSVLAIVVSATLAIISSRPDVVLEQMTPLLLLPWLGWSSCSPGVFGARLLNGQ